MATLRCLHDANVVRLLGVVLGGGAGHHGDQLAPPPCIITEYLAHGDLKQYLQRHRAQAQAQAADGAGTLARTGSYPSGLAGANTLR